MIMLNNNILYCMVRSLHCSTGMQKNVFQYTGRGTPRRGITDEDLRYLALKGSVVHHGLQP